MAVVTLAELKTYFETGDKPTEQQFVNLIDTLASLPAGLTNQQLDAINAANNPNSGNPFATILDTILSIDITNANLITAITNSEIEIGVKYRVLDCPQGVVWIWGIDANVVSRFAALEGDWDGTDYVQGMAGTYDVATNTFTEQGRIATAPSISEDDVHGYYVNQLLTTLDTGVTYKCTDASTGAAVWQAQSGEWTPILTVDGSVCTDATLISAYFEKNGNVCSCSILASLAGMSFSGSAQATVQVTNYPIATSSFNPIAQSELGKLVATPTLPLFCNMDSSSMIVFINTAETILLDENTILITFQYKITP